MKSFSVCITETLEQIVQVEAEGFTEALEIAKELYKKEDIVLTDDDLLRHQITVIL